MKATIDKINNTSVICFDDYFTVGNNLKANAIFFKSGHIHFIDITAFKNLLKDNK
ncbi:MAG: hypothetical protein J6S85_10770 [Methanobrevibacter sp.]|nr:hypothetical protein [Methanobrevibacter sp.]